MKRRKPRVSVKLNMKRALQMTRAANRIMMERAKVAKPAGPVIMPGLTRSPADGRRSPRLAVRVSEETVRRIAVATGDRSAVDWLHKAIYAALAAQGIKSYPS